MSGKTLNFLVMDAPFEQARVTTAFRVWEAALEQGHNVYVFAYEGAVALSFAQQQPHANSMHGRSVEEEKHPLTREWIVALQAKAKSKGCEFKWVNCGLCVDERGVNDAIAGCSRGAPKHFWEDATQADGTLVIGTRS